jgi:hypothetical protein
MKPKLRESTPLNEQNFLLGFPVELPKVGKGLHSYGAFWSRSLGLWAQIFWRHE